MPKGPQGQKRPADAVSRAVMIGRIATGEVVESVTLPRRGTGTVEVTSVPKRRGKTAEAPAEARMELAMSELSILSKELFGNPGSAIGDIKFYPGESNTCSPDEIAIAIREAIHDIKDGNGQDIDLSY